MSKLTHHFPLELLLPLEFHRVRSWDLFYLFCLYWLYLRSRVSFSQAQNIVKQEHDCFFSSICWWHSATYWYKLTHILVTQLSHYTRILHRQGEWLALTKWFSLQSIKIRSHCFFKPRSKPLAILAESIQSISVAGSPISNLDHQ